MAFGQNPGALFVGTLSQEDKAFVASVLKAAKEAGYEKVVEPCSGGLAMSCIAADCGFEDIEASDITLFSGILGRYVEGRSIEDMDITRVEDGSKVTDPLDAMMEIKRAELVGKAGSEHIRYYRKLWTHNFTPSQSSSGYAMIIDGYLVGIFGYVQMATTLGDTDAAFLGFGMCAPTGQRLSRLMYTLAMQKRAIRMEFDDVYMARIKRVRTVMLTKHQESKEMRGLMKLVSKDKDNRCGFKLTYETAVQDRTYRQCLVEWAQKEESWQRKRQKA